MTFLPVGDTVEMLPEDALIATPSPDAIPTDRHSRRIALLPEEYWWGGAVDDGTRMPFRQQGHRRDLNRDSHGNQATPLLLSSRGRSVWSDQPFTFTLEAGETLWVQTPGEIFGETFGETAGETGSPEIVLTDGGGTLAGAFQAASRRFFPPSGRLPDPLNFTAPQYNSWIEMQYEPTQDKIRDYARQILASGLPPGVLMIDDNWFEDHGDWRFHRGRFPDPKAMVRELHDAGFRVMLWVSPFISPDSGVYRDLAQRNLLVRDTQGVPVIRSWWNGQSALLDLTHAEALAWLDRQLRALQEEFTVDGFKFDAGDPHYFHLGDVTARPTSPAGYCEAWARVGLTYAFNEYRACWKMAGQPLVQRLRDKLHSWGDGGLADLVPNGLAQGLAGYSFICPDMVGGGDVGSFTAPEFRLDQELFIRTVQASALFPILQFSLAPWRVLDAAHWGYCQEAVQLRQHLAPTILSLARQAARTGEPILRPLCYVFPGCGLEQITDQFLLGDDLLVAPVTVPGADTRTVVFPPGRWRGPDGPAVDGPRVQTVAAPLPCLPWFRRECA